jgi:iron complex transport system substrate-binding protein
VAVLAGVTASVACGREATPAPGKAQRIVSLVPAVTEMLFAIGAGPQVVGVSSYDHFPAEVEALPKVGALVDPDTERILSLRPDLVVVYGSQSDVDAGF